MPRFTALIMLLALANACTAEPAPSPQNKGTQVDASGKVAVPLAQLPPQVLAAIKSRAADLRITKAETETRNSVRYYDVAGTLPDGSDMELDLIAEGPSWRVVETQRDMKFASTPAPVQSAAKAHDENLVPTRVIESRQEDGVIIYELYSAKGANPQGQKAEVRWDGRTAQVLTSEWVH